jgi:flagellar hook-associated protein 3 FlgL
MGNTTIAWGGLEGASATSPVSIIVNGSPQTVAVAGLSTAATPTAYASNLALTLNAIAASGNASAGGVPSTLTASASTGTVTLDLGGAAPNSVTPDAGGTSGETTWVGGSTPDGTVAQTPNSSTSAYTLDSALIDSNYSITYGVSSNDPSFQKLVSGLRFITTACAAGSAGNTALYQTDMQQAATLINAGLAGIQTLHAQVASNQNTMTQQTTTQNTDITTLKNQIADITSVDLTTVGAEINTLQTQLQASYSATATIEKLSLVNYL